LKVRNIDIQPLWKPKNAGNKAYFEATYLGKNVKNALVKSSPKFCQFWAFLSPQKS
jgi:hypothetical protein